MYIYTFLENWFLVPAVWQNFLFYNVNFTHQIAKFMNNNLEFFSAKSGIKNRGLTTTTGSEVCLVSLHKNHFIKVSKLVCRVHVLLWYWQISWNQGCEFQSGVKFVEYSWRQMGWNIEQCYTYCVLTFRSTTRVTAYHVENLISAKNSGEDGKSCTNLDDNETWLNTKSEYDAKWKPAEWGREAGGLLFLKLSIFLSLHNHLVTNSSIFHSPFSRWPLPQQL